MAHLEVGPVVELNLGFLYLVRHLVTHHGDHHPTRFSSAMEIEVVILDDLLILFLLHLKFHFLLHNKSSKLHLGILKNCKSIFILHGFDLSSRVESSLLEVFKGNILTLLHDSHNLVKVGFDASLNRWKQIMELGTRAVNSFDSSGLFTCSLPLLG